jgi:ribosomal protein S18 acetylase RimI-like enzyme
MSTAAQLKRAAREAREARARERASTRRAALYAAPAGGTLLSAMEPRNLLEGFAPFTAYDRNGLACDISFTCPGHASWTPEVARFAFELTRANMRALYEAAPGWGWKEGAKRAELGDGENRYLVARAAARGSSAASAPAVAVAAAAEGAPAAAAAAAPAPAPLPVAAAAGGGAEGAGAAAAACKPGDLLGFVSFRFLPEGEYDLLYIYELQMGPHAQRRGLGKHMMQICELVARKCGMHWCVTRARSTRPRLLRFRSSCLTHSHVHTPPPLSVCPACNSRC